MKHAKLAALLAASVALSLTNTGCRKGPDKLTEIPGQRTPAPTETKAGPIDGGAPVDTGTAGTGAAGTGVGAGTGATGIPAAAGDFTGWKEDRDTFHAEI